MVTVKTKIWISAGVFMLSGVQVDLSNNDGASPTFSYASASAKTSNGEGGEGGEGGESGEKKLSATQRKIEYLKNMTLVEGHLIAGVELYRAGAIDAARSHMKHPKDELYRKLEGGLKEFRGAGFAESLKRLGAAVDQKRPIAEVDEALKKVTFDIDTARAKAKPDPKTSMLVISQVMRVAADEYGAGVKDGKIVDAHEYQDAYGFFMASKRIVSNIKSASSANKPTIEQAEQLLKEQENAWQSLTGETSGKPDASSLYAVASKIELAASSL